jgi:hypothetical protein
MVRQISPQVLIFDKIAPKKTILLTKGVQQEVYGNREKGENVSACKEKGYKRAPALEKSKCLKVLYSLNL